MLVVVAAGCLSGAMATSCTHRPAEEDSMVNAPATITVTSTVFGEGQRIPTEFTCDGPGRVPSVSWSGAPADAAALALVVDDPDAPQGTFTHWVVLDLPGSTREVVDGELPPGAATAKNSGGRASYYPPCPPSGTHHYRFTVYALDRPTGLSTGVDLDSALKALEASTTAWGRLVGVYSRDR
jgi:Raf kinase inhibitor-like YbhB/YbcL family protein